MLNYAEMRIQRDLDLLASQVVNVGYNLSIGNNTLSVSSNDFQTIQSIAVTNGVASIPILPTSKEYIQNVYNDMSYQAQPICFAFYGGDPNLSGNNLNTLLFGPYPDQAYLLKITGTRWLPSLYATASTNGLGTTYISSNYPDLLLQASGVYISQYQRNFSPTANDPQMPGSFEYQYGVLLKSALELENRKKFRDAAWSSQSQSPVATPTR